MIPCAGPTEAAGMSTLRKEVHMIQGEKRKLLTARVISQMVTGNVKSSDPPRMDVEVDGANVIVRVTGDSLDIQTPLPAFGSLGFSGAARVGVHPDGIINFDRKAGQEDVSLQIVDGSLNVEVGKVTAKFISQARLPPIAWPAVREVGAVNSSDLITALYRPSIHPGHSLAHHARQPVNRHLIYRCDFPTNGSRGTPYI